ncbi:MAG TPA: MBL fold metallo-hydrolase [Acidimicrobiales bacterium]|nr:MBL fold metallo-hydrolase [Acidimicrobiales bacterium]
MRGSCPCPSEANRRYGGNTACVALEVDGQPPIVLDLGTGLRQFGMGQPTDGSFRGTALITHVHWDHVQGLPFFPPADRVGASFDVYGPRQEGESLGEVFSGLMRPPYFPVQYSDLRGRIEFHDVQDDVFAVGEAKVKARSIPHIGPTVGYRIEWDGASLAYISDHQQPHTGHEVCEAALELADGVDLLIHDAQYTPAEFSEKAHWGHCTVEYAVLVAKEAGARRLALFHHDPAHGDEYVDQLLDGARCLGAMAGIDVMAASEGLVVELGPHGEGALRRINVES